MEITVEKRSSTEQKQTLNTLKAVRVAVYARVSTDKELQLHSLEEQRRAFANQITRHPGWMLVDIYADEGITGTSVRKRRAFLRMMQDCEAGKIDYILTRSISRFARNTVECLSYVRRLQSIGVQIYFEKENIDTAAALSEMILTVLAAFAQEESRSISENLKWGIRKRFAEGKTRWTPTYGYRKAGNGEIEIDPEEAAVVRLIFGMYQHGRSVPDILKELERREIPSARGKPRWSAATLKYLLQNEKYIGDLRLQKWVSIDHISHKSVRNDCTAVPRFYVRNHHPPIIDRHTWQQVQRIMELKNPHGAYSRYPYCDTSFICPRCGRLMVPRSMKSNGCGRMIGCFGDDGCQGYALKAALVESALLEAYHRLEENGGSEEAMKRMREIKKESPKMNSVQYYWLDDLVERVEVEGDTLRVFWKCGLDSSAVLHAVRAAEPAHVAELYRNYMARRQSAKAPSAGEETAEEKMESVRPAGREPEHESLPHRTAQNLRTGKQKEVNLRSLSANRMISSG